MKDLINKLAIFKIMLVRGKDYLSLAQFFMVLYLFSKETTLPINNYFLLLSTFLILMIVGFIDYKFFYPSELLKQNIRSPISYNLVRFMRYVYERDGNTEEAKRMTGLLN